MNYAWAHDMHVEDPDGNVLRLGPEPKSDRPFEPFQPRLAGHGSVARRILIHIKVRV